MAACEPTPAKTKAYRKWLKANGRPPFSVKGGFPEPLLLHFAWWANGQVWPGEPDVDWSAVPSSTRDSASAGKKRSASSFRGQGSTTVGAIQKEKTTERLTHSEANTNELTLTRRDIRQDPDGRKQITEQEIKLTSRTERHMMVERSFEQSSETYVTNQTTKLGTYLELSTAANEVMIHATLHKVSEDDFKINYGDPSLTYGSYMLSTYLKFSHVANDAPVQPRYKSSCWRVAVLVLPMLTAAQMHTVNNFCLTTPAAIRELQSALGTLLYLHEPLSRALELFNRDCDAIDIYKHADTRTLMQFAQSKTAKVDKENRPQPYFPFPPEVLELARQFDSEEDPEKALEVYRKEHAEKRERRIADNRGVLTLDNMSGLGPSPNLVSKAMIHASFTPPPNPSGHVFGGYDPEEIIDLGGMSKNQVDAVLELSPLPPIIGPLREGDSRLRPPRDRFRTLRLAAVSKHVFYKIMAAKGETPQEFVGLFDLARVLRASPPSPEPSFADSLPGNLPWCSFMGYRAVPRQPWLLAEVIWRSSGQRLELELPLAYLRILCGSDKENCLLLPRLVAPHLRLLAKFSALVRPHEEPTREISVGGKLIYFPERWLQGPDNWVLHEDAIEFKPYLQDVKRCREIEANEVADSGIDHEKEREVAALKASLAKMKKAISGGSPTSHFQRYSSSKRGRR